MLNTRISIWAIAWTLLMTSSAGHVMAAEGPAVDANLANEVTAEPSEPDASFDPADRLNEADGFSEAVTAEATGALTASHSLERALDAALHGPERKKLKVYGHEFNVKPAEIVRSGSVVTANGQISHHLTLRPDDQVYYVIEKRNGVVTRIDRRINRGGLTRIAAPIISVLGGYFGGIAIPPDKIEAVGRTLGTVIDGSWESVADMIIANIALRL